MTDWLGVGISFGALVLAYLAWRDSRASASASEGAAERAARSAERSAAALEAQASRFTPSWELSSTTDGRMLLTNRNGEDALDVTVEVDAPWFFFEHEELEIDGQTVWEPVWRGTPRTRHESLVGANSSVAYIPGNGPPNLDAKLRIRWRRPNGVAAEWSTPLDPGR